MEDIQLSPHFKLSEFTRSATATRYGIDNSLNPSNPKHAKIINNLRNLCVHVLEPLRQAMGVPITIGSGYRCKALNSHRDVGGATNSKHLTGHAADIHIPDTATGKKWMLWIIENCEFYKVIWETADKKHFWIHVSLIEGQNKNHVVSYLLKPSAPNR